MMKKISLITLSLVLSLSLMSCKKETNTANPAPGVSSESTTPSTASNSNLRRYGVESGMVKYELSGSQTGTKTIYWDNWGMREATYKESSITAAGVTIDSNEVSVMDGEWIYNFDPEEKTGTKITNSLLQSIASNTGNDDLGEVGLQILEATGAKKTGTENVAGKTCDVYTVASLGTETCVWNAVTLKTNSELAGISISEVATEVSTGSVPADVFEIPSDISFTDVGDIGNLLKDL